MILAAGGWAKLRQLEVHPRKPGHVRNAWIRVYVVRIDGPVATIRFPAELPNWPFPITTEWRTRALFPSVAPRASKEKAS